MIEALFLPRSRESFTTTKPQQDSTLTLFHDIATHIDKGLKRNPLLTDQEKVR